MPTTDALLTVDEAAAFLRVSRRTVYQLIADGLLRPRVNSSPATVDSRTIDVVHRFSALKQ